MHSQGFVHRDLKVENVLVNYENDKPVFKLADFGSAVEMCYHCLDVNTASKEEINKAYESFEKECTLMYRSPE